MSVVVDLAEERRRRLREEIGPAPTWEQIADAALQDLWDMLDHVVADVDDPEVREALFVELHTAAKERLFRWRWVDLPLRGLQPR